MASARHAKCIVTISNYCKDLLRAYIGERAEEVFMLPSAVDCSIFKPMEKDRSLLEKYSLDSRPVILSLARLATNEHKGQHLVLMAMEAILREIPDAIYLVVGSGQDDRFDKYLSEHPELLKSVVKVGPIETWEKTAYYNLADVYVLPSKLDGFLIVYIEALACGIPVVATDGYGCREGLLNGRLGALVKEGDINDLATEIVKSLRKAVARPREEGNTLSQLACQIYGIDAWYKRIDSLIEILEVSSN